MTLIDSHCHLDYYAEKNIDVDEIIKKAEDAGIKYILTIGTTISDFAKVRAISEKYENVFCVVGVHPHHAYEEPNTTVEQLIELSNHPKVVGFGEAGLDYCYDRSPRDIQKEIFRTHIHAAQETGLPLAIHTREADEDAIEILSEEYARKPFDAVIHCFTSGEKLAEKAIELGFYISASGIITFKKSDDLREKIANIPLNRLFVETDAPFLAPEPFRGKPNEPAYVVHVAKKLAEIKQTTEEDIWKQTTENFFTLFKKAKR
ncbi:MAG: TatD family hydrolase [Alphaproteobacteria bacterium]|nr:TatD family hydrolase [Alphaproteobacteria bacterium]